MLKIIGTLFFFLTALALVMPTSVAQDEKKVEKKDEEKKKEEKKKDEEKKDEEKKPEPKKAIEKLVYGQKTPIINGSNRASCGPAATAFKRNSIDVCSNISVTSKW